MKRWFIERSRWGALFFIAWGILAGQPVLAMEREEETMGKPSCEARINSLISRMTLEEKAGQLNLISFGAGWGPIIRNEVSREYKKLIKQGKVGALLNAAGADLTKDLQEAAVEGSRLGIPLLFGFDVVHGLETIFPISLAEASAWDPGLAEASARFQAREASSMGINWTYAPMVDIARDPRWGRIAEGAGEDPYLGSLIAGARIRGYQGDLSSAPEILACAKHFAAYGGAEGGRDYNTVDLSERTLREVYLPPFKAAVDSGVETVMAAFNEIGGIPSCANKHLLQDILRKEWKFRGMVVSDWNAIGELVTHGVAPTRKAAALLALTAGVDMDMESRSYVKYLPALVREGALPEKMLNESVKRVLRAKFRLGLFDNPYKYCDKEVQKSTVMSREMQDAAHTIATRSMVLLKNEGKVLPLRKDMKSIAVIGPLAHDRREPLHWHLLGNPAEVVTVLEGIRKTLSGSVRVLYAKGCEIDDVSKDGFAQAIESARDADAVVLALGEKALMSGEAHARSSLELPGVQNDLAKEIYKTGKPIVVVLMNGRPLSVSWIAKHVPAIIEAWFLGTKSGTAIADVLFGDYNPSGKLPVSYPRTVGQIPVYYNHKNTGRPGEPELPYTSKYVDLPLSPLYPFGYGLSYTKFEYGKVSLTSRRLTSKRPLGISVKVANVGDREGEEIVQLYVRDQFASVTRPVLELKGFRKIHLRQGASETVQFTIEAKDLAFYNQDMQYIAEPGIYRVYVGPHSADLQEESFELVR